eukprot:379507_1
MCNETQRETLAGLLCEYKSTRFIRVRNVKLSIIYWMTLFLILVYVIVFTIFIDKGYQATGTVSGTTSVKLKGSGSIGDVNGPIANLRPLDAMDLVQPSMEENAFFVITAMALTPNQTRKLNCPGNADSPECTPQDTTACNQVLHDPKSNGLFTGNCAPNGRCEMYSWCPLENDVNPFLVNNVGAFTAFVKIDINFEAFNVARTNIYDTYGPYPTFGYNLFSVDDMLSDATNGAMTSYKNVSRRGAIILVSSIWNCDLDKDVNECNPSYKFKRIDGEEGTISSGYNYRTVTYDTSERSRYLRKYYGIRFIFITDGTARQFNIAVLTVTLGAGLAYLGFAAIVADIVLERFLPESKHYQQAKNRQIQHDPSQVALVAGQMHTIRKYTDEAAGGTGKIDNTV